MWTAGAISLADLLSAADPEVGQSRWLLQQQAITDGASEMKAQMNCLMNCPRPTSLYAARCLAAMLPAEGQVQNRQGSCDPPSLFPPSSADPGPQTRSGRWQTNMHLRNSAEGGWEGPGGQVTRPGRPAAQAGTRVPTWREGGGTEAHATGTWSRRRRRSVT